MEQPLSDTELVVATPERVSFEYQVAGLGTRGIAQILDLLILAGVLLGLLFVAIAMGQVGLDTIAYLLAILGSFVIVFGYFWTCQAFWSGLAPAAPVHKAPAGLAPASPAELMLRRLDPELRRFVTSYARRRPQLPLYLRTQLADLLQASLRGAAPDVFMQHGPLAALDYLA